MDLPGCLGVQSTDQLIKEIKRQAHTFVGYKSESRELSYVQSVEKPKIKRKTKISKPNVFKIEPDKRQVIYYG